MKHKKSKFPLYKDRAEILTRQRNLKMARSAHAYVRGTTVQFYDWLSSKRGLVAPRGPGIWICGDAHIGNLGPIASAKGKIDIQIRDLDQTVIGNPAHDLIRLGLSLATAARGSDLPGVMTAKMLEHMLEGYEDSFSSIDEAEEEMPEVVAVAMEDAMRRNWKHLAKDRLEDTHPTIPLGKHFWPLTKEENKAINALFAQEDVHRLVTLLRSRDDDAEVELLDSAYWMKGCSSLGNLRYAVLARVGGKKGELCLIDIKEAMAPAAPHYKDVSMPRNNAMRVAEGARALSPALGQRLLPTQLMEHSVFLRELLPQDLKIEMDHLSREEAVKAARYLAMVIGKAHARQMDKETRKEWKNDLKHQRSKTLDAPSWLWSSIVDLMVSHEAAYLEHCRRFAASL